MVAVALVALVLTRRPEVSEVRQAGPPGLSLQVSVISGLDTLLHRSLTVAGPVSALGALEQAAAADSTPVGIRQYDFGKLVVSIGGITAGSDGDWTYRVNDSLVPVAAEACQLGQGDRLEFRFGKAPDDAPEIAGDST